jgi:hypothetical protein
MNMINHRNRFHFALLALAATLSAHGVAQAESSSRYSLPWQLRPVTIDSAARLDGVLSAFNDANGNPIGTGGGDDPEAKAARANLAAMTARPADDVMFAVNYLTPMVGGDFAYVSHGFTAQVEGTLQELIRVRGGNSASALDQFRTNAVLGLHLGYFIGSYFSVGSDLRYQRWLSHPTTLDAVTRAQVPLPDRDMDAVTLAAGLRLHFRLGKQTSIHPGLSVMRGFDSRGFSAPMVTAETTAVQLDVPVTF